MFGNLGNRIVSSIASLTALVFSSYHGNEADFSELRLYRHADLVTVQCVLEEAFEHDFEQFFRSGEQINVWFMLQVKNGQELVEEKFFHHSVLYDPMTMFFEVYLQEQEFRLTAQNYEQLLDAIARFDHTISVRDLDPDKQVEILLTAYLPSVSFSSMDGPFDLMLLWNFKRPVVSQRFMLHELET